MENKTVTMAHGAGGRQTSELIDGCDKRNIISVNGWNCQCYFRFLYAADYSGY